MSDLLPQIKDIITYPKPKLPPYPDSWNKNLHCSFHNHPGHTTDTCFTLRRAIQRLIDNGDIHFTGIEKCKTRSNADMGVSADPLPDHASTSKEVAINAPVYLTRR